MSNIPEIQVLLGAGLIENKLALLSAKGQAATLPKSQRIALVAKAPGLSAVQSADWIISLLHYLHCQMTLRLVRYAGKKRVHSRV